MFFFSFFRRASGSAPHVILMYRDCRTFGLRVQAFNVCEYAPREDIFVFYNRLSKSVQEVEKMSHLAREVGEDFKIPKFLIMQKLFRGVAQCRQYSFFTDKLLMMPPKEWLRITPESLVQELRQIKTNLSSLDTTSVAPPVPQAHSAHRGRDRSVGPVGRGGGCPPAHVSRSRSRSGSRGPRDCPYDVCFAWSTRPLSAG
jgi:hypothetical protein